MTASCGAAAALDGDPRRNQQNILQLTGEPGEIDADALKREIAVTFAKRTRKYTSYALPDDGDLMGTSEGYKGAVEGGVYSKLIEPYMMEALDGFDADDYRAQWQTWADAVQADDLDAGQAASDVLVDWNCQYQAYLGIAECTSSVDEM